MNNKYICEPDYYVHSNRYGNEAMKNGRQLLRIISMYVINVHTVTYVVTYVRTLLLLIIASP